jgi:hypothetical protein
LKSKALSFSQEWFSSTLFQHCCLQPSS